MVRINGRCIYPYAGSKRMGRLASARAYAFGRISMDQYLKILWVVEASSLPEIDVGVETFLADGDFIGQCIGLFKFACKPKFGFKTAKGIPFAVFLSTLDISRIRCTIKIESNRLTRSYMRLNSQRLAFLRMCERMPQAKIVFADGTESDWMDGEKAYLFLQVADRSETAERLERELLERRERTSEVSIPKEEEILYRH